MCFALASASSKNTPWDEILSAQPGDTSALDGLPGPLYERASSDPTSRLIKRAPLPGGGSSTHRNAPLEDMRMRLLDVEEHRDDGINEDDRSVGESVQDIQDEEGAEDGEWSQEEAEERTQQLLHAQGVMLRLRQLPDFSRGLEEWRQKVGNSLTPALSTFEQQSREFNLANAAIPMIMSQAEDGVDLTSTIDLQEELLNRLQLKSNENYTSLLELVRKRHISLQKDDIKEEERTTRLKCLNEDIPRKAWLVAHARQKMYQRYLQLEEEVKRLEGSTVRSGRR